MLAVLDRDRPGTRERLGADTLGELESFDATEHGPLYAEQAGLLESRGVDLLVIETFFDVDELVAAVEAVRGVSSLPVVALLTFDEDGETVGGVSASTAAVSVDSARLALANP